jgi:hypothetical protein
MDLRKAQIRQNAEIDLNPKTETLKLAQHVHAHRGDT